MSISNLYQDYGVETAPEGHKHCRPGWLNIVCPHCNGDGYHLGFNESSNYYYCFKCGSHTIENTLIKLLKINYDLAKELSKVYTLRNRSSFRQENNKDAPKVKIGGSVAFKFPTETTPLKAPHKRYLEKRGFDSNEIIKLWRVQGTSPTSILKTKDGFIPYNYRILIPIHWDEKVVTFQCRDYTGKQELKYLACPESREIIHHKHILYGHPSLWNKRKGILVEGVFDVWRFGINACATLGTGYTSEQLKLLTKLFDELVIIFDPEVIAQRVAKKLQEELSFRGVKVSLYNNLKTDPGDLPQDKASKILKELGF